jgi:hypothetical protein
MWREALRDAIIEMRGTTDTAKALSALNQNSRAIEHPPREFRMSAVPDNVHVPSSDQNKERHGMGKFDWVSFENGKARFCGAKRGADDAPHWVLAVQLGDGPRIYYVDFDIQYEEDGTHYNVEIISFGFGSAGNAGNPNVTARAVFSAAEVASIETLISSLIRLPGEQPTPLHIRSRFRGGVSFRDGWIRTKSAE